MLVSVDKGFAFQRPGMTGRTSLNIPGPVSVTPHWAKLTRAGTPWTAFESRRVDLD